MGEHFIAQTAYRTRIASNQDKLRALALHLMADESGAIYVAENGGRLVGMIGAFAFAHPVSGERVGSEIMWWMEPDARGAGVRLLRAAERWAKTQGATRFQMIAPTPYVEEI